MYAKRWRGEIAAQHGHFPAPPVVPPPPPTFAECAAAWRQTAGTRRRASTMDNYERALDRYLLPAFGERPITDLKPKVLRAWIAATRASGSVRHKDRGVTMGYLRVALGALSQILDEAVVDEHLVANPLAVLTLDPRPKKPIDPFTSTELRALFAAAERLDSTGAWPAWLRMWAGCGARRGETQAWRWGGLDLDAGTVAITQTFSRGRLGPPKTASSTREPCFLHPVSEGAEAWTPWRRYWHREGPRPGPTAEGAALLHRLKVLKLASAGPYVFGGAAPAGRVEGPWRKTVRAAGVRYRCPETLRHTCASLLLSVGAPLLYVQRVGGWASAKVLLDNYATYIPEESGGRLTAPPVRPEPGVETVVESVTQ